MPFYRQGDRIGCPVVPVVTLRSRSLDYYTDNGALNVDIDVGYTLGQGIVLSRRVRNCTRINLLYPSIGPKVQLLVGPRRS